MKSKPAPSVVYVLDATPLLAGYTPTIVANLHYTTQEIMNELGSNEQLRVAVAKEWLHIREPSTKSLKKVEEAAEDTGDSFVLSPADLSIIALSLEIQGEGAKVSILTDDYAVQNVAAELGLPFQTFVWKGIQRHIAWELYCPRCRKTYNTQQRSCPDCGSTLKRRPFNPKRRETDVKP